MGLKIEHVGLWVKDLETMKEFYETYLEGVAGELYHNKKTDFRSYFLTFDDGATRLELMNKPALEEKTAESFGYAHIAYQVSDEEVVNTLHQKLVNDGYKHVNGPRTTGDGYYEAVVEDPEGNLIEITA
jgi:lactoylglutathione lyase